MDRSKMLFCPKLETLTTEKMSAFLATKVFGDPKFGDLLQARYVQMGQLFRGVRYNKPLWNLPKYDCENCATDNKRDARLKVPRKKIACNRDNDNVTRLFDYNNFGHDMPVWVTYNKDASNAKRIMIVSQDPLRNDDLAGSLYLSTPFGVHSSDFEDHGMDTHVKNMLNVFLDADFCVFLTDYMKFFDRDKDFIRNSIKQGDPWRYKNMFSKGLEVEIDEFDPNLIIMLGCDIRDEKLTETSLVRTHPAGAGFEVQKDIDLAIQDIDGTQVERKQDIIAAYHPSGARGRATPIIRNLVWRKVGRNVEHPIKKYYELIAEEACNYLSGPQ